MVVKFVSPLLTLSPLQTGSKFMLRNHFGFNLLRYQYTLSYPGTRAFIKENRKKRNGMRRSSCTLQNHTVDGGITHSPFLKMQNRKKRKYRYSSMPRVDSTPGVNPVELHIEMLMNGYRPIPVSIEHITPASTTDNGGNTTMYEVSLDLNGLSPHHRKHLWMNSATGVERYEEWEGIPTEVVSRLRPFVPPHQLESSSTQVDNSQELDIHGIDPHGLLRQIYGMIHRAHHKGQGGRKRDINILLQKKKKN